MRPRFSTVFLQTGGLLELFFFQTGFSMRVFSIVRRYEGVEKEGRERQGIRYEKPGEVLGLHGHDGEADCRGIAVSTEASGDTECTAL